MASFEKTFRRSADQSKEKPIGVQVRIRLGGHRHVETCRTMQEAKAWAGRVETSIREFRCVVCAEQKAGRDPAQTRTVGDLLSKYGMHLSSKAPQTFKARKGHLAFWQNKLGTLPLAELTPAHIADQRDAFHSAPTRKGTPRSAAHVNRNLATLSHALTVAVKEWGWLPSNPARNVSRLKGEVSRERFLSDDERTRLLRACKESPHARWLYPLVTLALSTGARQGELRTLTWNQVNLQEGWITLNKTKTGQKRGLPLTGHAQIVMKEFARVKRLDTDLVFPGETTKRPIVPHDAWRAALKAAEILGMRFHDLRHSAASEMLRDGATLPQIGAVLGHLAAQTTRRYAHLADQQAREIVERMNKRVFGSEV